MKQILQMAIHAGKKGNILLDPVPVSFPQLCWVLNLLAFELQCHDTSDYSGKKLWILLGYSGGE